MDGLEDSGELDGTRTRQTIPSIDHQIETLLTRSLDPSQQTHSTKVNGLRRRRNALVPFYQLPIELLLAIVERCLEHSGRHYTCLLRLSLVSTFFKNIVQGRSELWAHIVAGLPIPGVETCLVRSLGHWQPLYIHLDAAKYADKREGMPKDRSDWERITKVRRAYGIAYVDRVLPHISRVRVASLKISTETYVFLEAILTSPAPLLEELKVKRTDMDHGPASPVPAAPPAEAFCGHAPSLKRLDIGRGFHSLINSFKFSGLSSLSIVSEETLAVDKIIDIIIESPGMSSLTIVEQRTYRGFSPPLTNGQANDTDHNRNHQHRVLPQLRKLTLRLEGADRLLYLLEHVQAPACTQLDLRHGTADPPLNFVRRSLDPFLSAFQQTRTPMISISMDLGRFSRFGCEENGPSVSIQTSGDTIQSQLHVTSLLDWVIEVLGDQSADGAQVTLRLKEQGFRLDCSLPAIFTRLHRLPAITALFLDGATSRQDWILKLMGTDWPSSDINPQFFLPCLTFIYLSGFDSPGKDLVEVLEARYGKSLPQDGCQLPQLPPPLEFLKFGGCHLSGYKRKIRAIVGERCVGVSEFPYLPFEPVLLTLHHRFSVIQLERCAFIESLSIELNYHRTEYLD